MFSSEKVLGKWRHKILSRDLQKGMQESYWRLIWCICICCMHSHSQGFKGDCETKRTIPAIPREPGWFQELLRCRRLLFASLFTFYDVVLFSRLCKSWSFFDWSFSRLQHPWSWRLRSRLILLGFRELNKLQFPLVVFPFSQRFPVIYSLKFAFHFKKVSTQFGQ